MQNRAYDLIVVGGGILGAFHAYFALLKNLKVLLLEKDARPSAATVRNFGQIVPSGMAEGEWFSYGQTSLETYKKIQSEFDIHIRQNGSVYIASSEAEMAVLAEKHTRYQNLGYASELLSRGQCQEVLSPLKPQYCYGGLAFPQEVTAEPAFTIHRLLEYLVSKFNLDYRPATPVLACTANDSFGEITDAFGNRFVGRQVIICNGRDLKFLFPEVFLQSDLQICKLQMMATYPLPGVKLTGSVLTGLSIRRYDAFKSCAAYRLLNPEDVTADLRKWGIHLLFKQAVDGSIIIGDSHEYTDVAGKEEPNFNVEEQVNELILNEARQILNLPDWRIRRYWNGYYAQSKTKAIFEQVIDQKIHLITGIGGKGMTTAAGFAKQSIEKIFNILGR